MALFGVSSDAWVGLVGVVAGGGVTYLAQRTGDKAQRRSKERDERKLVSATALLIQDDFLHYQSTLARSLDECRWWKKSASPEPGNRRRPQDRVGRTRRSRNARRSWRPGLGGLSE